MYGTEENGYALCGIEWKTTLGMKPT